jgi:hypothetical protein
MTTEQFKVLITAQPFRPFIIHLADGRQLAVKHREFLAMSPSGRTVIVYLPDDTYEVVDLLLVTSLRVGAGGSKPVTRWRKQA